MRRKNQFLLLSLLLVMLSACESAGSWVQTGLIGSIPFLRSVPGSENEVAFASSFPVQYESGALHIPNSSGRLYRFDYLDHVFSGEASAQHLHLHTARGELASDLWKQVTYPVFYQNIHNLLPLNRGSETAYENSETANSTENKIEHNFEIAISLRYAGLLFYNHNSGEMRRAETPLRYRHSDEQDLPLYKDIMDLWQNPQQPNHMLALNKQDLLQSFDGGRTFQVIDFPGWSRTTGRNIFTSLTARVNHVGEIEDIWIGSAYNGIFRLQKQGNTYQVNNQSRGIPFIRHQGSTVFYEEIIRIYYDESARKLIAFTRFQPSVNIAEPDGEFISYPFPGDHISYAGFPSCFTESPLSEKSSEVCPGYGRFRNMATSSRIFALSTSEGPYVFRIPTEHINSETAQLAQGSFHPVKEDDFHFPEILDRTLPYQITDGYTLSPEQPSEVRAFYVSPLSIMRRRNVVMRLLDDYEFNSVVIDAKDDFGRLLYGSNLPEAEAMRNQRAIAPVEELVADLNEKGIYTIARVVVFKDPRLFRFDGQRYAIWDSAGGPWMGRDDGGDDMWIDPFHEWVQDYNIRVAREIEELGFNEIQFDYIRFPTDGPIYRARFRGRPQTEDRIYRTEVMESFLRQARMKLSIPISVDIYGYSGIYRAGAVIGQDMNDMGDWVDIISPMHYSSHFGNDYLNQYERYERTYELLKLGTERPDAMSHGMYSVRPWLQAFRMKTSIWGYGVPYMQSQICGVRDGGGSGYLFWGPVAEFDLAGRSHTDLRCNRSSSSASSSSL